MNPTIPFQIEAVEHGQWRIRGNPAHGIPSVIVPTEVLANVFRDLVLTREVGNAGHLAIDTTRTRWLGNGAEMGITPDRKLVARQLLPSRWDEIKVIVGADRCTAVWKQAWEPVIADTLPPENYDGYPHKAFKIRVHIPRRRWLALVDHGTYNLIKPELQMQCEDPRVEACHRWGGGNHSGARPCFGTLQDMVDRKGVSDFSQIDALFFGSAFSMHIQYGNWNWSRTVATGMPTFEAHPETGLLYVAETSLVY